MKIEVAFPPFYERIVEALGTPPEDAVYTYGDTIYSPKTAILPSDILAHEAIHQEQQVDPDGWWNAYLVDPLFRLAQEREAFQVQYRFLKSRFRDRNHIAKLRRVLANQLAGQMYGNLIKPSEAWQCLK